MEPQTETAAPPVDETLTHKVTRISTGHPHPFRIFFNPIGRSLEWNAADAEAEPGTPQGVCAAVAEVIAKDSGLTPHFRIEPIAPPAAAKAGPAPRSTPKGSTPAAE